LEQKERNSDYYEAIFRPFQAALKQGQQSTTLLALECLAKLFDYDFWDGVARSTSEDSEGLIGNIIETISGCFVGENTDEKIQMLIIKVTLG
jgi:hypothetical protein